MRGVSAMIILAICALMVIVYQAVQQEMNIRNLKTRIAASTEQVKVKEDGIVAAKTKVDEMNKKLSPLTAQKDQLKKQKDEYKKSTAESDKELGTCQAEMGKLEKQRTEAKDALLKVKEDQEAERKKAEEEIQGLKKQILDRDLKICEFVDLKVDVAKKLCAGAQAS